MKWISVHHQMPTPYQPVLVFYSSGFQRVSWCIEPMRGILQWYNQSRASEVTHWMALPDPPKDLEENLTKEQAVRIIGDHQIDRRDLLKALRIPGEKA